MSTHAVVQAVAASPGHGFSKPVQPAITLLAGLQHSWLPFLLSLPAVFFLPAFSLVTGIMGQWLPLSKPSEEVKNSTTGCAMMAVSMAAAGIIGGLASYPLALLGALLVGQLESFSSFWASAYKEVLVFTLIIPVLWWRSLNSRHVEDEE